MQSFWRPALVVFAAELILHACGGNVGGSSVPPPQPQAALSVLAGNPNGAGNVDGSGAAAAFQAPYGVATDSAGNAYVTDSANRTVRKVTLEGVVTTLAGTAGVVGSADGRGAAAQFNSPLAIAADGADNLYVTDVGNGNIRKITPAGAVTTLAVTTNVYGSGIAIDVTGNVYVTDAVHDAILKITPAGAVTMFAGNGSGGGADGQGAAAQFNAPRGLTIDSAGNLFVADTFNCTIRKITPEGAVTTLAGFHQICGSIDGAGDLAEFHMPEGIAIDSAGNLYVTDSQVNETVRKITPAGVVTTLAGTAGESGSADGAGAAAKFDLPGGIAIDSAGEAYVADTANNAIRKITVGGLVSTLAGGSVAGYANGMGAAAQFHTPTGLAADRAGNIYAVDSGNAAIRVITPIGTVTTHSRLAPPAYHFSDNYGPGIAINSTGLLYFVEVAFQIQQFGPEFASYAIELDNSAGLSVSLAACAQVANPCSFTAAIATDASGNAYFTADQTINKVTAGGIVTILAGATGVAGSADGQGASARFDHPWGVASDGAGNLYATDAGNNTIRKITAAGVVTTLAGSAGVSGSADGIGPAANFNSPAGIAINGAGDAYVADTGNNSIRKITPAGIVSTIVGQPGHIGFTSGALPGTLAHPVGLTLFGNTLYATCNNAIVEVTNVP